MLNRTTILTLSLLVACSGKGDDTGTETVDDGSIDFLFTFHDFFSGDPLAGGEYCLVEPAEQLTGDSAQDCLESDDNGEITWTWEEPVEGPFSARFTMEDYPVVLGLGHYDEQIDEAWTEQVDEDGYVTLAFTMFNQAMYDIYLSSAALELEEGTGQLILNLVPTEESVSAEGASVSLAASSTMAYLDAEGNSLDPDLSQTSASGSVLIANVEPGDHTLTIEHPTLQCDAGGTYPNDEPNVFLIPFEADTLTFGWVQCTDA
ncbi:MAG: hypothetical protein QGG40_13575 [Myxococcota bacterium]|nr:hypothetical protein [Myxococcota bacterium]